MLLCTQRSAATRSVMPTFADSSYPEPPISETSKKPRIIEAVIDGDLHYVVVPRHLRAFVRRQFIRGSEAVPSPVNVKHHRAPARQAGCPDVQLEHVLALPAIVPILNEGLLGTGPRVEVLRAVCTIHQRRIVVRPGSRRLGRKPAVRPCSRLAIGHTLERENSTIHESAHLAVLRPGNRRARRRAVTGFLMG